jgi:hypothetical protein
MYGSDLFPPVAATQHDSGKPEGENRRQGSADEPFNREISANNHDNLGR